LRRFFGHVAKRNPIPVARANVAHHYDLSDTLYELFLDADRQYSCAYFQSPEDTLEGAQHAKMQHIAAKLLLRPGQRVLDIGSGWGGLAIHLARIADVHVTGLTLPTEQLAYACRRADESGIASGFFFVTIGKRPNDTIASFIGMFEHVGPAHYREYLAKIKDLLEDDGGRVDSHNRSRTRSRAG
jgi:cyclopropane-fatty-acyl-phospholipid synthase